MQCSIEFCTRMVFDEMRGDKQTVPSRKFLYGSVARPRATFVLWMACHGRLATKDRDTMLWNKY